MSAMGEERRPANPQRSPLFSQFRTLQTTAVQKCSDNGGRQRLTNCYRDLAQRHLLLLGNGNRERRDLVFLTAATIDQFNPAVTTEPRSQIPSMLPRAQ
jgi:hypothetical protein